ncbi:acyl-CoA N-acyltransferase [Annulohypoxylon truncatum]|uniref:acyl-CoA N-acyltransferase n=1 Tax=Annulohypoxylon truncatum TaxID=327061 RepID=UPI00200885DF|nr:acyl-CoA N-acyltransferase [Annulohypoxylon truncatum]KAI1213832.1 acyl-CoA N-acyltransferase [Annulohypoxylon truncatum]
MAAKVASPPTNPSAPHRLAHDVTIGEALVSEAAAIALIGATTFAATFGYSVPDNDLADFLAATYSEKAIEAEISSAQENNVTTFVARSKTGVVLGFVQLVRELTDPCLEGEPSSHAELRRLYVDVSTQGLGVGSKLIAAVEEKAKAEGFKQLWLTVWEDNVRSRQLYEKLSYVKKGETDFATGACIQTDWVLSKNL